MSKANVSTVLQHAHAGRFDRAYALCSSIVDDTPGDINALCLLGSILLLKKDYPESERLFRKVLEVDPDHVEALNNLGVAILEHKRDLASAEHLFRKVIQLHPSHVKALLNIGNICSTLGQTEDAKEFYLQALSIDPNDGAILNNLGALYVKSDQPVEAIKYYRKANELLPHNVEILTNLIVSIYRTKDKEATIRLMDEILALSTPGVALFPVFSFAKRFCMWDRVDKVQSKVVKMVLNGQAILNSLEMMNLDFLASPGISNQDLYDIHRITGNEIEKVRARTPYTEHHVAMQPTKRLKIGLLSPDFRQHAVNVCLRGIINHYDRKRFAVHCYSSTRKEDDITALYRSSVDAFVNVTDLTDSQLAERIYEDGIHFLIDLAGYTQHGRLGVMSYSPAPVQLLYLGYPYTSGLAAVDYFITDPYLDGPDNAPYFTEKQLRLPECFTSFDSLHEQEIDKVIAFQRNGYITFGSLTNTYKLNPNTIATWSRVLSSVPGSKILLNHPNYDLEITRSSVLKEFAKHGIPRERVIIIWAAHPSKSHLRYYNDIDIVLDTFPQTGGTTTLEAAWMGVPLITLVGDVYHQRLSYTVISNIGINVSDLIASSETEFVDKAVALAFNIQRLTELHQQIPESLKSSILCDPARLTRHLEAALIEGWNRKFPAHQLPICIDVAPPDTIMYHDVLREQQGWFDPDYHFVYDFIQPNARILDIGDDPGVYSVPLANKLDESGMLWAYPLGEQAAASLKASKERNRLKRMHIFEAGTPYTIQLDEPTKRQQFIGIDFVRISTNGAGMELLRNGEAFFSENSPLILCGIRHDQSIDLSLIEVLKEYGYQTYRLVPGLNLLVPFISQHELDAFTANLFCCKHDRAGLLAGHGLLVKRIAPLSRLPDTQEKIGYSYIAKQAYATELVATWSAQVCPEQGQMYLLALDLFATSKLSSTPVVERYACLQAAHDILVTLVNAQATLPRLLSLVRIFTELGRREHAVNMLNHIVGVMESGIDISVEEPFLALSERFAALNPGEQLAEWLFISVIEQRERLRAFSSYLLDPEQLEHLQAIQNSAFPSEEVGRRLQLIKDALF